MQAVQIMFKAELGHPGMFLVNQFFWLLLKLLASNRCSSYRVYSIPELSCI